MADILKKEGWHVNICSTTKENVQSRNLRAKGFFIHHCLVNDVGPFQRLLVDIKPGNSRSLISSSSIYIYSHSYLLFYLFAHIKYVYTKLRLSISVFVVLNNDIFV
jgi:hypothetical protein